MRLGVLLLLNLLAATVDARCVGLIVSKSGPGAHVAISDAAKFTNEYVSRLPMFEGPGASKPDMVIRDAASNGALIFSHLRELQTHEKCDALITERWMGSAFNAQGAIVPFGKKNPFSSIPAAFKQMWLKDEKKAVFVTLGWIPLTTPSKKDGETYVITITNGHQGWPQYVFAIFPQPSSVDVVALFDRTMDWVTTADANVIFGKWFYVVPDNSKLQRRVRIDLMAKDGTTVVASTPCTPSACYPTPAVGRVDFKGTDGTTYTVCGPGSACPQLMPRPTFEKITK